MLFFIFAVYSFLAMPVSVCVQFLSSGINGRAIVHLRMLGVCVGGETGVQPGKKRGEKRSRAWISMLRRAAKIGSLDVAARVGTGDAMHTALAAGALQSALLAAMGALGALRDTHVRVMPDFSAPCFVLHVRCIFSVTVGDIILSAAAAARRKKRKEGLRWSSIPSRT